MSRLHSLLWKIKLKETFPLFFNDFRLRYRFDYRSTHFGSKERLSDFFFFLNNCTVFVAVILIWLFFNINFNSFLRFFFGFLNNSFLLNRCFNFDWVSRFTGFLDRRVLNYLSTDFFICWRLCRKSFFG